jgi:putative transposase
VVGSKQLGFSDYELTTAKKKAKRETILSEMETVAPGRGGVSRQFALLGLPRSTLYYQPTPFRQSTLQIIARIDALYLEDPCSGSHRIEDYLAREGIPISRARVRNLMRRMGLRARYQKSRTTAQGNQSERFPCLVDVSMVTAVDQVWATDITYIPLQKGFIQLVEIVFSKYVLSWKVSNSLCPVSTTKMICHRGGDHTKSAEQALHRRAPHLQALKPGHGGVAQLGRRAESS